MCLPFEFPPAGHGNAYQSPEWLPPVEIPPLRFMACLCFLPLKQKNRGGNMSPLYPLKLKLALDFDNFSAFVETAVSADSMGELQLTTCSGYFSLRYCHVQHSFYFISSFGCSKGLARPAIWGRWTVCRTHRLSRSGWPRRWDTNLCSPPGTEP